MITKVHRVSQSCAGKRGGRLIEVTSRVKQDNLVKEGAETNYNTRYNIPGLSGESEQQKTKDIIIKGTEHFLWQLFHTQWSY